MKCEPIERWISVYQDLELVSGQAQAVREHLALCPECWTLYQDWQALRREVRDGLAEIEAPETLHDRVMRQIPAPKPARLPRPGFRQAAPRMSIGLAPLAAALAGLLLVSYHPRQVHLPPPPAMPGYHMVAAPIVAPPAPADARSSPLRGVDRAPVRREQSPVRAMPSRHPRELPGHARAQSRNELAPFYPEARMRREMRRLRVRRPRCPVTEAPLREWWRRRHERELLARRLEVRARPSKPLAGVGSPPITIVDYVLPEVPVRAPVRDERTDFVLGSADPGAAEDRGVSL